MTRGSGPLLPRIVPRLRSALTRLAGPWGEAEWAPPGLEAGPGIGLSREATEGFVGTTVPVPGGGRDEGLGTAGGKPGGRASPKPGPEDGEGRAEERGATTWAGVRSTSGTGQKEGHFPTDPRGRATGLLFQEAFQFCPCLSLGPHPLTFPVPVPESPVACVTGRQPPEGTGPPVIQEDI